MQLMICTDGVEFATVPLIDGNDPFNAESERGAFDRAYEAKQSNPDAVVTIVIVTDDEEEELIDLRLSASEISFISDSLTLLAGVDEGEHTDYERLIKTAADLETLLPDKPVASGEFD